MTTEPLYYRTDPPYAGGAPCFYDVDDQPWAAHLRAHWQTIRDEYEENVRRGTDGVVEVFNPTGPRIVGWRSVNFQTYLWRFPEPWLEFPRTAAVLNAIPGLSSAFINVLEPGASIPPHQGDSNAIMRCHLGLDVPDGDCAVRIGSETRRCADGVMLAFCDAHEHASWNKTDARRVVLVLDVMLPEHRARQRWISANVLAATAVVWLEARLGFFRRPLPLEVRRSGRTRPLPQPLRTALRIGLALPLFVVLAVRGPRPAAA